METTYGEISYRTASQVNDAMLRVYNYMALAVAVSSIVSLGVASSPLLLSIFFGPITKWITIFAPLVLCFIIPPLISGSTSKNSALALLFVFASAMGLSTSVLLAMYTGLSVVTAFMGAFILFATMSFYGYFTKQSLDSWGKYLIIGLFAIILTGIINIFLGNSMLQIIISSVAIILFMGLTAYDTQRIREDISVTEVDHRPEVLGALSLYCNFINIFVNLLQLFGNKDE